MKKRYYIAYGSNLNVAQMRWRCPDAEIVGVAELEDTQLMFRGSMTGSYLTVEPKAGSRVPVAIWEVSEKDERHLDRYEGYPTLYYKTELAVPVRDIHGGTRLCNAFIYVMTGSRKAGAPSDTYMAICREGYEEFGFDPAILTEAHERSEEAAHEGR